MTQEVIEQTDEELTPEAPGRSVGEQLRTAREAQGLGREDVAAELRLHIKLVAALEESDRAELPPPAFVGGYIRSYARLLGLPAEQMVAEYLKEGEVAETDYRPTDRSGERMVTSKDPKFRLMTYVVVGLLLLLFGVWWANDRYSFVPPVHQAAEQSQTTEQQETLLPLPPQSATQEEGMPVGMPAAGEPAEGTPSADVVPAQEVTPEVSGQDAPVAAPLQQTVEKSAADEAAKPAPQVSTEPLPLSTPQATLRLDYQAASWTRVEDAKGRLLIYETVSAGRRVELHGVAPFKVFLGYAQGVKVYVNGALFSHDAYIRGELARFRAGSSRDNSPLDR